MQTFPHFVHLTGVIPLVALIVSAVLLVVLLSPRRDRRVARGRLSRMWRIGSLSARVSTSMLGARVRRLFAGKSRRRRLDAAERQKNAARVAETMGQMKGAFMKLGQMLSFVSDDVPEELQQALKSLQASAPPMDFAVIRDVAERELQMPLERAFARFDEQPLASASIGQVHRARLATGEEVVVKIQYPGVAEAIRSDLENAAMMYALMAPFYPGVDGKAVIDELRGRILEELDYAREADRQEQFAALYDGHPFIRIPRVVRSHSTARVLVSEFVAGRRFDDVLRAASREERNRYGEIIYRFVFGSIARHGLFNGDPHPGNYIFDDKGRIAFVDFGCVKEFPPLMLTNWQALVTAHLDGDRQKFAHHLVALNFLPSLPAPDEGFDIDVLYDYFAYFYEPFRHDAPFTFDREYNKKSFGVIFKPQGRFAPLAKKLNMPRDFVFVNRIQWGVFSILAQLAATENWHRIHREMMRGEAPPTMLGRLEEAWRRARENQQGEKRHTPAPPSELSGQQ
jgi:predicted unusual protein kinase regulating ubiquinone biosynthesis (AarF/ABC1/UbiB family)